MHDAARMREADRVAELDEDPEIVLEQIVRSEPRLDGSGIADELGPREALDVFEDDDRRAIVVEPEIVDRDDVRMFE